MARPVWNGAISFGLVSIPVKLFSATENKTVSFHQLDSKSGGRVRQKRVSEATGEEVPYEDIVKGYELGSGRYVTITDEEMASIDPVASRTVDLLEFVDLESIDPIFYESTYYLAPDPATAKPYALLLRAMTEAQKVGIARFVMRGKERLCAIRPHEGTLVLETMRYADEVRDPAEIPGIDEVADVDLRPQEVAMAEQLIASLDADFDPAQFEDSYREKVLELIARKESGEEGVVETPAASNEDKVIDLMAALKASVAEAKQARQRHPAAATPDKVVVDDAGGGGAGEEDEGEADDDAAASNRSARRPAKKATKAATKAAGATKAAKATKATKAPAKAAKRTRKSA
jgi:DNA end-binding protein Ku